MMALYDWLQPTQQHLRDRIEAGRLPHALLLVGHPMQGALALQDWLIATILCTESNHDPCGLCHSCELFQAGHHPDFLRLQPEGKAQWIKVDAVRELNQFCQATAQQGVAQVVTLESADRLNTASANALLKTLEEPPAQTFLVLQTAQPGSLLPTIRSRSQRVLCPQPTVEQSQSWLLKQGVNAEDADRFLRLSKGAPLQALEWAQSDQEPKHDRWLQLLLAQCKAPRLSIADIQSLHADEVSALLQIWLDTIRQMIRFVQSKEPEYIAHLQPVQDWAALCETYTSDQFWQQLYDQAVLTQQQLQRPNQLNANLLLEQLWLRMAKQCLHAQSRVSA